MSSSSSSLVLAFVCGRDRVCSKNRGASKVFPVCIEELGQLCDEIFRRKGSLSLWSLLFLDFLGLSSSLQVRPDRDFVIAVGLEGSLSIVSSLSEELSSRLVTRKPSKVGFLSKSGRVVEFFSLVSSKICKSFTRMTFLVLR